MPYQPGLDGMRALAVALVLLYHAEAPGMPGGFFGVEVFFVLSGYLITALLLAEWHNEHRIALGNFYLRRARRLLPALFLMLAAVGLYSVLFLPDEVHALRGDTLGALVYVENWWQIFQDRSYFAAMGRPPLLLHLWSLAVEEQFYLLWPLLFTALLKLLGMRPWPLCGIIFAGSVASAVLMWVFFPGIENPTRVYFGTDTRASGLLLGAALAPVWPPWRPAGALTRAHHLARNAMGAGGLLVVGWYLFRVDEFQPWIYAGGFFILGLATLLVIAASVPPGTWIGRLLGIPPLVWLGLRSYSLYVWHWPIYQLTRADLDLPLHGAPLLALRLCLSAIVAELSYRFVETPIRHGALARAWRVLREGTGEARATLVRRGTAIGAAAFMIVAVIGIGFTGAPEPAVPPELHQAATGGGAPDQLGRTMGATEAAGTGREAGIAPAASRLAVGDSVMLGAAASLGQAFPGIHVNAAVSRQFSSVAKLVAQLHRQGIGTDLTVIHSGTNGTIDPAAFDQMMAGLTNVRCIIIMNLKVPRRWEASNNALLAARTPQFPNATLVDWHAIGNAHGDWFYRDGIHLKPSGRAAYAALIAQAATRCQAAT